MYVYNEITRQKELFTPLNPNEIKMYVCGSTVYDYFHIGNARPLVLFDFIRRFLEYMGYKVNYLQNFTDIDDKMINRANRDNITVKELADKFIAEYEKDAEGLGVHPATIHPKATEHIQEVIDIIEILIGKNHAYPSRKDSNGNSDVYFSTKSFKEYGKLSNMNMDDLEMSDRVDANIIEEKKDPFDFALWKAKKENEPSWTSPWGEGRPGWHIECSAMVKKYLGDTIDFHCGGRDLIFPHHENEIAQSECSTGKLFTRYWLHNGMINNKDGSKMAKSTGDFFTTRDISAKYGYMPIRFFLLASTYRTPVNFSEEIIKSAQNALDRIFTFGDNIEFMLKNIELPPATSSFPPSQVCEGGKTKASFVYEGGGNGEAVDGGSEMLSYREKLIDALCDDFNTADAISVMFDFIRDANIKTMGTDSKPSKELLETIKNLYDEFCGLFGFIREVKTSGSNISDDYINEQIEKRTAAKKSKDFKTADEIRDNLKSQGIIIEDTPLGVKWRRE
ncbi:MAG: cysteine--tRNA ligase [Oscillospiraceae bacterium]|nr:cysteine--tRNA ligase [Oscillospiraceae bacterium]